MQLTRPNISRLGLVGLSYYLLISALVPACSVSTDPALVTDGGAVVPPGGDAAPDDAGTGAGAADGAPSPDAAPDLPHDRPPIDELTFQDVNVATFALG